MTGRWIGVELQHVRGFSVDLDRPMRRAGWFDRMVCGAIALQLLTGAGVADRHRQRNDLAGIGGIGGGVRGRGWQGDDLGESWRCDLRAGSGEFERRSELVRDKEVCRLHQRHDLGLGLQFQRGLRVGAVAVVVVECLVDERRVGEHRLVPGLGFQQICEQPADAVAERIVREHLDELLIILRRALGEHVVIGLPHRTARQVRRDLHDRAVRRADGSPRPRCRRRR